MNLRTCNFFEKKFFPTIFPLRLKLGIQTSIFVNHYHLFTLCVFDYSSTHTHRPRHCPCNTCVFVREQPRGHAFLLLRDPQTHKCAFVCTMHRSLFFRCSWHLGISLDSQSVLGAHFCSRLGSGLSCLHVPLQFCCYYPSPFFKLE